MQDPRNSCVVAAKMNERESRAVPAVATTVTKLLRKNATEYLVSTSQDYNGARGQLTEDEDANEKPDEKQNPVQSLQGLTNILHAFGNRLALLSDFNNLANHLIKRDIAVQITIDGVESFLGLL